MERFSLSSVRKQIGRLTYVPQFLYPISCVFDDSLTLCTVVYTLLAGISGQSRPRFVYSPHVTKGSEPAACSTRHWGRSSSHDRQVMLVRGVCVSRKADVT